MRVRVSYSYKTGVMGLFSLSHINNFLKIQESRPDPKILAKECSDYLKALDQLIDLPKINNFFSSHFNYWPGHCPFHPPDKRKSFGFYKGEEKIFGLRF
jgi:hypothetical protein